MSEFVNYNKRDVTLPPGCKDLTDVLQSGAERNYTLPAPARRRLVPMLFCLWDCLGRASQPAQGFTPGGATIDRLGEVPRYVAELLKSRSDCSALSIGFAEQQPSILLLRESGLEGGLLTGVAIVGKGAESEQGIRQLLQNHGIPLIADCHFPSAEAGAGLVPGIWYMLTPVMHPASEMTTDLLRTVYGFTDESRIQFQYCEIDP